MGVKGVSPTDALISVALQPDRTAGDTTRPPRRLLGGLRELALSRASASLHGGSVEAAHALREAEQHRGRDLGEFVHQRVEIAMVDHQQPAR